MPRSPRRYDDNNDAGDLARAAKPRTFRSKLEMWKKKDKVATLFAVLGNQTGSVCAGSNGEAETGDKTGSAGTEATGRSNGGSPQPQRQKSRFQKANEDAVKTYRNSFGSRKASSRNLPRHAPTKLQEMFEPTTIVTDPSPDAAIPSSTHASISASEKKQSLNSKFIAPSYETSDSFIKLIVKALQNNIFFHKMTHRQRKTLAKAMEPLQVQQDSVVIKQGSRGDYFYIIGEGTVEFRVNNETVGEASSGGSFGELALLYSSPRAATVVVKSQQCKLFRVDKTTFRNMLRQQTNELERTKVKLLQNVPFLKDLSDSDIKRLGKAMTPKVYEVGDVLATQGERNSAFYILDDGEIERQDADGNTTVLTAGSCFGEMSIATNEPSPYTFTVKTKGLGFFMKRKTFERVLGTFSRLVTKAQDRKTLASITAFQHAGIEDDKLDELAQVVTDEQYSKGDIIFQHHDETEATLYLVLEGSVKLSGGPSGSQKDKIVRPFGYFGLEHMLIDAESGRNDKTSSTSTLARYTATANEKCVVGMLTLSDCRIVFDTTLMLGSQPKGDVVPPATISEDLPLETSADDDDMGMDDMLALAPPPMLKLQTTVDWLEATSSSELRDTVKLNIALDDLKRHDILGEGQFGQVWLVSATLNRREKHQFALKIQKKDDPTRGDSVDVIRREMKVMELMDHPYIVNLIHHYEDEANLYILMGLVHGGELFNVIHQQGDDGLWYSGLPEADARFYGMVVADTLDYMHRRHYVFRDLKPENILIDKDGYPMICDFGFAKFVADKTYTLCGTPNYLAPEMVMNQGHNIAVDHWALGVVIYEMVAGENPFYFDGMDQMELFRSIVQEQYYELPEGVSNECEDVIAGLLVKEPTQRLGSLANRGKDIIRMPWFKDLDLYKLRQKKIKAPFQPQNEALESLLNESMHDLGMSVSEALAESDLLG